MQTLFCSQIAGSEYTPPSVKNGLVSTCTCHFHALLSISLGAICRQMQAVEYVQKSDMTTGKRGAARSCLAVKVAQVEGVHMEEKQEGKNGKIKGLVVAACKFLKYLLFNQWCTVLVSGKITLVSRAALNLGAQISGKRMKSSFSGGGGHRSPRSRRRLDEPRRASATYPCLKGAAGKGWCLGK